MKRTGNGESWALMTFFLANSNWKSNLVDFRLLDMPELEREAELAGRRDEISKRRQKAELAALVRSQRAAANRGKREARPVKKAIKKKSVASKKGSAAKKKSALRRKKRSSDDDEDDDGYGDEEEAEEDEDEDEEEEEEESDFEETRGRGKRAKRAVGTSDSKASTLNKLKKSRAKAAAKRKGLDAASDDEEEDDSSEYDAEEAEALWARKKERERERQGYGRGARGQEQNKPSREQDRIAAKRPYVLPDLDDVNAARLRRDHFTRLVHRPDWLNVLEGRFVRIEYPTKDRDGHSVMTYRLVQILDCGSTGRYYEISDQYTNVYCTMLYGEEKLRDAPLSVISSSSVTLDELERWKARVHNAMTTSSKMQRMYPSKERTQDQAEELETYIARPFTEDDITKMLNAKRQARLAYEQEQAQRAADGSRPANGAGMNGSLSRTPDGIKFDAKAMAAINDRARKADRLRIAEAERRKALLQRAALGISTPNRSGSGTATPTNGLVSSQGNSAGKLVSSGDVEAKGSVSTDAQNPTAASSKTDVSIAVHDVDVDLGDF